MNIRQIEAFHAVMETGSVTMAGERLGISQPAVSKLLRAFAETCGFALFVRRGGRMVPTADARLLSTEVERLFSGTDRIARLARAVREREWGEVSICAPPALAARFLAFELAPFMAAQNDLRISLASQPSLKVAELVAAQQVDIGLSVQPYEDPLVKSETLMRFEMVCVMPAGHHLAAKEVVQVEDLRAEPFVALARDDCAIMTIDRAFQLGGVTKQSRIEVPMSETACDFVASGAGVSVLPAFVGLEYSPDKLVRRRLEPQTTMDLWMLTPAQRPPSLAAQRVADVLRAGTARFDLRGNDYQA